MDSRHLIFQIKVVQYVRQVFLRMFHVLGILKYSQWPSHQRACYWQHEMYILLFSFLVNVTQLRVIIMKKGRGDWGVWYLFIFLYVQFWIRLAAVCYHGEKVRNVASPAMRSVNRSRDTRHCVQNEPECVFCVILPLVYSCAERNFILINMLHIDCKTFIFIA